MNRDVPGSLRRCHHITSKERSSHGGQGSEGDQPDLHPVPRSGASGRVLRRQARVREANRRAVRRRPALDRGLPARRYERNRAGAAAPKGGIEPGITIPPDDVDATHARLKDAGVDVDAEVSRYGDPVPPMFWLRDHDANVLMVVQTPSAETEP